MTDPLVKTSLEDGVLVVTIDHPPVNALSTQTMAELSATNTEMKTYPVGELK
jgi:enoyl-CoA hydratase/carnithine racemase